MLIHEATPDYGLLEGVGTGQDMALIAGARKEGRCLQNIRGNTSNIIDYHGLSWIIMDYHWLSWIKIDYC